MTETKDSAFSEFFRNATEEERLKVYQEVMEKATQSQLDTLKEIEENNKGKSTNKSCKLVSSTLSRVRREVVYLGRESYRKEEI